MFRSKVLWRPLAQYLESFHVIICHYWLVTSTTVHTGTLPYPSPHHPLITFDRKNSSSTNEGQRTIISKPGQITISLALMMVDSIQSVSHPANQSLKRLFIIVVKCLVVGGGDPTTLTTVREVRRCHFISLAMMSWMMGSIRNVGLSI